MHAMTRGAAAAQLSHLQVHTCEHERVCGTNHARRGACMRGAHTSIMTPSNAVHMLYYCVFFVTISYLLFILPNTESKARADGCPRPTGAALPAEQESKQIQLHFRSGCILLLHQKLSTVACEADLLVQLSVAEDGWDMYNCRIIMHITKP